MNDNEIQVIVSLKDRISKEMRGLGSGIRKLTTEFKSLAQSGIKTATVALIGLGFAMRGFINESAKFEQFKKQFEAFTGSAREAEKVFQRVLNFASKTPFTVSQITQASTILMPLEQMGFTLEELLTASGNLAGSFNLELSESALNLSKAFTAGIGSAELLRDRGVRSFIELRNGIDLTKVSQEELQKILMETFTTGSLSQGMAKLSVVYSGISSNLGDSVTNLKVAIGDIVTQSPAFLALLTTMSQKFQGLTTDINDNRSRYQDMLEVWVTNTIEAGRFISKVVEGTKFIFMAVINEIERRFTSFSNTIKKLQRFVEMDKEKKAELTAEIEKNNEKLKENESALEDQMLAIAKLDGHYDSLLEAFKNNKKEIVDNQQKLQDLSEEMAKAGEEAKKLKDDAKSMFGEHFDEWVKDTQEKALTMEQVATTALDGIADATASSLRQSIEEGKSFTETFKNMMKNMLFDIAEDIMRSGIRELLGSVLGGVLGGGASQGGGGIGGVIAKGAGSFFSSLLGSFFHDGGVVGIGPRFHDGGGFLRHDERQAVLQTGERVLSREEVANGAGGGAKNITYNINAIDAKSFADYIRTNKEPIIQVVNEDITRDGQTRANIKRFGK